MNTKIFYYSLLEIGISVFVGVLVLYATFMLINKLLIKRYNIEYNNISYGIFCSSILFSVSYLLTGIKTPILNSVKMLQNQVDYDGLILLDGLRYAGLFLVILLLVILLVHFISFTLFSLMTRGIKELNEIEKNNIAVSLIIGVVIIAISIMVKDSLYLLLESFVPYPDIPKFLR